MNILLRNGRVVTPIDGKFVVEEKDLYICNGKISKLPAPVWDRVLDVKGRVIMPGLVNAHHHIYSTLSKGIPVKGPLNDFVGTLEKLWWKLDRVLEQDDIVASTIITLRECIKAGVTTVFDHHISVPFIEGSLDSMAKEFERYQINGVLCFETSDRNGKEIFNRSLKENVDFYKKHLNSKNIKGTIGLHASFTLDEESLPIIKEQIGDAPIHIHVAEDLSDVTETMKMSGGLPVIERLDKYNLLNKNSLIVHGNNLTDEELALIKKSEAFVIHNPDSNMNNTLKIKNISETLSAGIPLTVGTDGMTSNMLKSYKNSFLLNRYLHQNPDTGYGEIYEVIQNAFKLKTTYGFDLGVLEGDDADVVVFDYQPSTPFNENTFLGHFVFGITESRPQWVLKGEYVLMDQFTVTVPEPSDLYEKQIPKTEQLFKRFLEQK